MRQRLLHLGAVVLVLAACGDDGRQLADPPGPTDSFIIPEEPGAEADRFGGDEIVGFSLTSPAFAQGGFIDVSHTCHGENTLPPLVIAGVPDAAVELAITVVDHDADGFVHLVLAGLPASLTELDESTVHDGVFGVTDDGVAGWSGPCPPADDDLHTYVFTLYAFAEPLGMEAGLDGRQAVDVIDRTAMDSVSLTGFYAGP